jgi:hypothetical protein
MGLTGQVFRMSFCMHNPILAKRFGNAIVRVLITPGFGGKYEL